ncbi:MAG: nitrous oxide reductase family maturation protein NosD [Bacteroidota bacterium]|nr:nitrous oxide reductase family maturation protein NosD [Bacteroidota bacterium]
MIRYLLVFLLISPSLLSAKTIVVSVSGMSLKSALSEAGPGDTIVVKSGTYREGNIPITRPVVILGENYPVFDGENKYEIFTIGANHVTIAGLKFIDTGTASMNDVAAVKVHDAKHVTIRNNQFENTFFGIHFSNSTESTVQGNRLHATATAEYEIGNGIHMWKCTNIHIIDNEISGHRDGIYFEFVTNSFITNNISHNNIRYGLHFMFSHNDEYRGNSFIDNGAGVAVMYTKHVRMYDNNFERNWGGASYGLLLKDIQDSEVIGNRFIKNTIGIHMEGVSRTNLKDNDFTENGYAIRLQASCDDNVFSSNNFSSNTFDFATNGTMVLNVLDNNYWDRYEGYDLDKDGIGDVPYRPVNMYSMIVERIPSAVLLWRSFLVLLMDRAEKVIPVVTPENLKDNSPSMRPYDRT